MENLNKILDTYKLPIGLSALGIVLIVGGVLSSGLLSKPKAFPKESLVQTSQASSKILKVDVSGAVTKPGVYSLNQDSRVEDAISASGGFAPSANKEFISKSLNLSQKIADGQKIYIPFEGEKVTGAVAGVSAVNSVKIGINTGTGTQLESLPGVGPSTAGKIISSRPYNDLNELVSKKAVSKNLLEKIKDLIDLN